MHRFDTFLAAVVSLGLGACTAEIRVEDDDDGGRAAGDAGDGDGDGDGDANTTSGPGSTTSSSDTTVEATRSELLRTCETACTTRCVEGTAYCERDCADVIDDCLDEQLAYIQCRLPGPTGPCPEEVDPEACSDLRFAVSGCENKFRCAGGQYTEEITCAPPGDDACECESPCNDGHVAVAACRTGDREVICDCYFDGEHRGECRWSGTSLDCGTMECCHPLLR